MSNLIERLMIKWNNARRKNKTRKDFLSYFSPTDRKFICGFPNLKMNAFDFHNVPTMHFKIHLFDFLKKLNYQMNSRKYTNSKKSVAEIERSKPKRKNKKLKKIKKIIQVCQNPKCGEGFEGFAKLKTHVVGKREKKIA